MNSPDTEEHRMKRTAGVALFTFALFVLAITLMVIGFNWAANENHRRDMEKRRCMEIISP